MIIRNVYLIKKPILQLQERSKSEAHNVYTEEINKRLDDKRLQIFDGITTHSYGSNTFKVCESERY